MSTTPASTVLHVDRLEFNVDATVWEFATERRTEIDALFAQMRQAKPALFNGQVLLLHRYSVSGGVMRGSFLKADYASFVAWQRWGRPEAGIHDCFGAAAVQSADGAFLLGIMGGHTFNAGQIYFPCGTPDPSDITADSRVDFEFSVRRELQEETGLDATLLDAEPGWNVVFDRELIAAVRILRSPLPAEALRARIFETLKHQAQPELRGIYIARSVADFDPAMRNFVKTFLAHRFAV